MTSSGRAEIVQPGPGAALAAAGAGSTGGSELGPGIRSGHAWFGLDRGAVLLMAFGFVPLLLIFLAHLWSRPHYQFFPLALAGAGFLAMTRLQGVARPLVPGAGSVTGLLMGFSLVVLAAAVVLFSPWLACVASFFWVLGLAWRAGGWRAARALLPALALMLTIVPPPLNGDAWLMLELRSVAVRSSSRLLDMLGVIHLLSGNVLELPQQKLLVEEACSGINSVLLTLAVCLFYLFWRRRALWWIAVCVPVVMASVVLGNVVRITLGAWLKYQHGIDLLSGWRHELAGLILLALYLVLIVSLDQLLEFVTLPTWEPGENGEAAPSAGEAGAEESAAAAEPEVAERAVAGVGRGESAAWWWGVGGAFAVLGLVQLGLGWRHLQPWALSPKSHLRPGASFSMPEQIGGWKRLQSEAPVQRKIETAGVYSQLWNYQRGGLVATVALDYPFQDYHDVTICYRVAGWHLTRQQRVEAGAEGNPPFIEVEMDKGSITYGSLWFSTLNEQGRWLEQPEVARRVLERWKIEGVKQPMTYRIQVLVTGYGRLSAAEREAVRGLFEPARQRLARQVLDQLQRPAGSGGGGR